MNQVKFKNYYFIAAIFVIGIAAFITYGYSQSIPNNGEQSSNQPKIEISPTFYDFGEIEFGKIAEYKFKIKNKGSKTLEIRRLATSCSCTTAKINKVILNPDETAELFVSYDTAAMGSGTHGTGNQERIIYVKTNDPANPQATVKIHAYVK
ncbi:MAG: DUF1573 domain-containing protein [bacterium]|nr:DUF1573 domain-containing protein [bacterium]